MIKMQKSRNCSSIHYCIDKIVKKLFARKAASYKPVCRFKRAFDLENDKLNPFGFTLNIQKRNAQYQERKYQNRK